MSEVKLILDDCLDAMREMEADSVDAIITDLPYGVTNCAWDAVIPFAPMWEAVKHVLKPRGAFVTTASQPFTSALVMSNLQWFRYEWVWEKSKGTGFLDANRRPLKAHENVVVFSDAATDYNPQMEKGTRHHRGQRAQSKPTTVYGKFTHSLEYSDERFPKSVMRFAVQERAEHPTQKPVALYAYLIRTYTNVGATVLDFTMGSGTTGVACVKTGRNFIGIELDEGYFDIATKRIAEARMQLPLLEVT